MCDFCHKHGEGKTWYLRAENYSRELARGEGPRRVLERTLQSVIDEGPKIPAKISRFKRAPRAVKWMVNRYTDWDLRRNHHGQVVPLEDLRTLMDTVVTSVVRVPCMCRKGSTGSGQAYCLAITTTPGTWDETCREVVFAQKEAGRLSEMDVGGMETLTPAQTLALLEKFEEEGTVHTLWTFKSPFIGGLCNCDPGTCAALRYLAGGLDVLAPGEYVAEVDREACTGCSSRACVKRCPFHAVRFETAAGKARPNPARCYGCGLCRTVCPTNAIALRPRDAGPAVLVPAPA